MSGISRKSFLQAVGLTAGLGAMTQIMGTVDAQAAPPQYQAPTLNGGGKNGRKVLILGAGIAGMMAAYEMNKAGYEVEVLEATERSGGRIITLRDGDRVEETGSTQRVRMDRDLYFNPGPWRIPYHHTGLLHYVREFGIQLEVFPMVNQNALIHRQNGIRISQGAARADLQGRIAEVLGQAAAGGRLDADLSGEDREKILVAMREWGVLDAKNRYVRGPATSAFRGWDEDPGARLNPGVPSEPLTRDQVLDAKLWQSLATEQMYTFQSTMWQPVDGMDMIAKAFEKQTKQFIRHGAKVISLSQDDNQVTAVWEDKNGNRHQATGDVSIVTIPLPVLKNIELSISPELERAIPQVPYDTVTKVGIQYKRRFWEQDENIYGGVSYTDQPMGQMSYPADRMFSAGKGVVLGAYTFGDYGKRLGDMSPEQRLQEVLAQNAKIHPQAAEEFDGGVSLSWHNIPWAGGGYSLWSDEHRKSVYPTISARHNRVMLAGEHTSYLPGWMEGSVRSAKTAIEEFDRMFAAQH
ncbi:MAG: FAD-dependent oxidoreductase [Actinomycetota bacterium]